MKLDDIKWEFNELWNDVTHQTREATVNYLGYGGRYESNRNKAIIGGVVTLVTYPFNPIVSFIAAGYAGVKAYQAYKDRVLK
jgi:hypothetical protein